MGGSTLVFFGNLAFGSSKMLVRFVTRLQSNIVRISAIDLVIAILCTEGRCTL